MMLSSEEKKKLEKAFKVNMIIWGAVFASLPIYLVICQFIESQQLISMDHGFPIDVLMASLLIISILELWVTFFIRKKMLRADNIRSVVSKTGDSAIAWEQQTVARYTSAVVLSSALSESIGIYGLVLFLLSQNTGYLYQFILLSGAAMLYFRPKRQEFEDFAQHVKRQMR